MQEIVLASNSQTRAEILREFDIPFVQRGVDFDEDSLEISSAKSFVYEATKGKLNRYLELFGLDKPVLCADTVVAVGDKILRKAKDEKDAKEILLSQSNQRVSILTCMAYKSHNLEFLDLSSTWYIFDKFDDDDLEAYLKSGEWRGKAGACMVEGFCKKYIKKVVGLESTAKGLSIEKLIPFLDV